VPGWRIGRQQFDEAGEKGEILFYVLEMDVHGTVTAKVMTSADLINSNELLANYMRRLLRTRDARKSVTGAADVLRGLAFR
jgi:hypothetical protein